MKQTVNPSLITSAALPYLISLPPGLNNMADAPPVLCFLHGYDEGHPTPIQQALTRHGPWATSSSTLGQQNFIVVAPQMPVRGDFWHVYADAVQDIITQVQHQHNGDARRTYLTGFSFGGNGVFDLARQQTPLWRALWPVDPVRVPAEDVSQPIWLSSGQVSRRLEDHFISKLHLQPLAHEQAGEVVAEQRVYSDQGQDHVGTATLAYADERIYKWLLAQ